MSQHNSLIYLDYAATTPVAKPVAAKMSEYLTVDGIFGNPASRSHGYGWQAEEAVETARQQVAEAINADPREIVFTSGATESDNLALKGAANFYHSRGKHIITSKIEHKAILDTCRELEQEGFEITYLEPQAATGLILPEQVKEALRDDTILVSLMMVNNELGTITDVAAIGEITREAGVIFHVDGAQSIGKVPVDLAEMKIDLMSFSGHKAYGPKGIGALFVRRKPRIRLKAEQHGGGHERGMRSGTLPTHQIVGIGEAFALASERYEEDHAHAAKLRQKLWDGLQDIEEIYLNGDMDNSVPNIINISFNFVEGESLMMSLKDLAVSSGSACTSATLEPSYVLRAIGRPDELAHSSIRFSFGRYTTEEDIDRVIKQMHEAVDKLRALSPLWDMYQEGVDLDSVEWTEH
ncbi:IscS subfamily cysteine desulfurase [Psychrobacter sp. F1192]|uniref:Cysteine desulfurase IscS n=1 Tax=Psychrobacter coccoides TaxID=2818440 RepID=A0ABS3NKP1_9GAMM|nr:IscS subfamily cysteine desulfurase [Psychrobacter coccoides]MBO1529970.1 IscS subfamily cysteine desulfurase [Psychrobacter coccoides]